MAKIISIMQDKFEKFVKENRADFDAAVPKLDLWDKIERGLGEEVTPLKVVKSSKMSSEKQLKPRTLRLQVLRYASVAAVGILLMVAGGLIGTYWSNNSEPTFAEVSLGEVSDEYAEVERYYTQQVNDHINQLQKYNYDKDILKDIAELDEAFKELKIELGKGNAFSDEEIIHAMIENYQMKIEILERVLERTQPKKEASDKIEM